MENHLKDVLRSITEHGWFIDLEGRLSERFAHLYTIKNELASIRKQILQLHRLESHKQDADLPYPDDEMVSIRQALWYSVLVRYFKLFANASQTPGYPALSSKDHLKGATPDLLAFHQLIKDIRDKHLSHGIHYDSQQMLTRVFFEIDPEDGGLLFRPGVVGIKQFSCAREDLNKFAGLVDVVLENIQPMLDKANEALLNEVRTEGFSDDEVAMLEDLYRVSLEIDNFKDEAVKYVLRHHFMLPANRKTERRLTKTTGDSPNHVTVWLDYLDPDSKMVLEFQFLPGGNGVSTKPLLITSSPIEIPRFESDFVLHVIKS